MYRRPKFLEKLLEARCEMAAEADYDVQLFLELARSGDYDPQRLRLSSTRAKSKKSIDRSEISPAQEAGGKETTKI